MKIKSIIWCTLILMIAAGCGVPTPVIDPPLFNILGTWEYSIIDQNGNTYDSGSITFSGNEASGEYTQLNYYNVEYTGSYTVSGQTLQLQGDEAWEGQVIDPGHMEGSWQGEESTGNWQAVKK